ncbi:MAG: response regulator transcription factor [Ignavibacteriales bacterium]|nr:response regulator transcription factor [Ignavibacteriales bacterium]
MLNKNQKSILRLFERGYTKQKASEKLGMNVYTLDAQRRVMFRMLKVKTMVAAVAKAIRKGMI